MTFQTQALMNDRVLVHGSDVFGTTGKTIVDASQWNELNARSDVDRAQQVFDAAVEEMFAPLLEAAAEADRILTKTTDSVGYVVIEEASEGQAPTPGHVVQLTNDSIILRLIEEGSTDRLMWVGDKLEILAAPATAQAQPSSGNVATSGDDSTEG